MQIKVYEVNMGQTCCISTDKIDQFIPEVKDVVLTDWKETIKLVLKYNNDDEDVSNRLQKHEIDILQEIFYGNSKLPNIVNGSNNYNSKRMLLSVSQLSSKFPLLSLDANDNDALFLGVTDKRISLGFSCRNLALAFRLLSYVMSPFSDSTELLRTQLINPSSISIDFRDFANTLSSCGLAKSSRREHLVFLFLLFADQLTSLHGKSMPLNSSDARNPTESASHRQSNTEPRLFLPLINGKVTKNRPPERNRDTERTEKRTSPFGLEPKDDRSQLRKSTSVSDFSADSTIGTESVADGGTSATTNDVNDNLQHLYELALSRSSFIRLIRFLALGPITRHMSWKTFESKLSRGGDQSRRLADQETTRQSTTFGVASGSINTENEAISDAVDYWSLHVNSAYSEDTLKRLESDQDLNLHWPLSLVEFLQFADNAVLDIVDVASDVEVVGKTTPRPDIDQNSNFASVLFRKAAIADALSTFCMFPHPQHEADLAVAAAERGHGSRNSDDQVFLVDDRFV